MQINQCNAIAVSFNLPTMKQHPTNCNPEDVLNICDSCAKKAHIHTVLHIFAHCEICQQLGSVQQHVVNSDYMGFNLQAFDFVQSRKFPNIP